MLKTFSHVYLVSIDKYQLGPQYQYCHHSQYFEKPHEQDLKNFYHEYHKLKHNKFVPGVKIPIKKKSEIKNKKNTIVVLAWNFFKDIKKNNSELSDKFINIKDLE